MTRTIQGTEVRISIECSRTGTEKKSNILEGQRDERNSRDYTCGGKNCHI